MSQPTAFAWVIEAPGQNYLGTREIGHHPEFYWTPDHAKATRFISKAQADGVMMAVRRMKPALWAFAANLGEARPVEHGWLATPSPDRLTKALEEASPFSIEAQLAECLNDPEWLAKWNAGPGELPFLAKAEGVAAAPPSPGLSVQIEELKAEVERLWSDLEAENCRACVAEANVETLVDALTNSTVALEFISGRRGGEEARRFKAQAAANRAALTAVHQAIQEGKT